MANSPHSINLNLSLLPYEFLKEKKLVLNVSLMNCQRGEYFRFDSLNCVTCDPNFFSFQQDFLEPSVCKICANEPFNCYGGFNLTPKSGYWRASYDSTNFIKCPNKKGKFMN